MNKNALAGAILAAACLFLHPAGAAEHPVEKAAQARYQAMLKRDVSALESMLHPELIYHHSNGRSESREAFLESIRSGSLEYLEIQSRETRIRNRGSWAVCTGEIFMRVHSGEEQSAMLRYTAVYEKTERGWQLLSWQTTRIPSEEPQG